MRERERERERKNLIRTIKLQAERKSCRAMKPVVLGLYDETKDVERGTN